jgi:hypothetical protein
MNMTKQEMNLINVVRSLCFEDILDAVTGIQIEQGNASAMILKKENEGDKLNAQGFRERAENLDKLQDALGQANADYCAHIKPEEAQAVAGKGVIQMLESNAGEVIHLFEVMKKHGTTCGVEFKTERSLDPLIGIAQAPVTVEYFEGDDQGDSVIIELGDTSFSFELRNHSFSKYVSDCQIEVCVMENNGNYTAFFNSGGIHPDGIEEANNYKEFYQEQNYAIDLLGDTVAESFEEIASQIRAGWFVCDVSNSFENDGHLYIDLNRSKDDETV